MGMPRKEITEDGHAIFSAQANSGYHKLSPFQNIRCFSFVKQIYLDIF
jgi:hypothetical protein